MIVHWLVVEEFKLCKEYASLLKKVDFLVKDKRLKPDLAMNSHVMSQVKNQTVMTWMLYLLLKKYQNDLKDMKPVLFLKPMYS